MSPVAEPKNLIGLARWRNVRATLLSLEKSVKAPISLEGQLMKELGDRDVASVLKLDSSVDAVAALDPAAREPEAFTAFSIPINSFENAKAIAERAGGLTAVRPGVYRIGRMREKGDVTCNLARSLGDAPARIVCAPRDRDLEALVPWMTRGMPMATYANVDLHAELRFGPAQEKFRPLLEQTLQRARPMAAMFLSRELGISDPALSAMAGDVADEAGALSQDLQGMVLDATLDGEAPSASIKGTISFQGNKSWTVKTMTGRADRQGPAPPIFWQAPKDSDSVSYARGVDPKAWEGIRKSIATGAAAVLRGKVPDADLKAIEDVLAKLPIVDAVSVSARGHVDAPRAHAKGARTAAEAIKDARAKLASTLGWTLVGYEGKSDVWASWLREVAAVWNRPTLQAYLKKEMRSDAKHLPIVKVGPAPGGARGGLALEVSVPVDSQSVWYFDPPADFGGHPKGAPAKGTMGVTLAVVQDGDRTWLAFASEASIVKDKLAAVKTGAPKEGTIASREGLDALKSASSSSGGFLSMATAFSSMSNMARQGRKRDRLSAMIASLPHKGSTPILLLGSVQAGGSPSVSFEMRAQRGTFEDISSAILTAVTMKSSHHDDEGGPVAPVPVAPVAPPPPAPPKRK